MKVSVDMYEGKPRVMTLSEALTPYEASGGQIERLERLAESSAKAIGNLASLLVEKGLIELSEAVKACEVGFRVELLTVNPEDCAHSEANRLGCPECGMEFKR